MKVAVFIIFTLSFLPQGFAQQGEITEKNIESNNEFSIHIPYSQDGSDITIQPTLTTAGGDCKFGTFSVSQSMMVCSDIPYQASFNLYRLDTVIQDINDIETDDLPEKDKEKLDNVDLQKIAESKKKKNSGDKPISIKLTQQLLKFVVDVRQNRSRKTTRFIYQSPFSISVSEVSDKKIKTIQEIVSLPVQFKKVQ